MIEEEPGSHYSVDDTTGANQSECMVNDEPRNDECTNTAFYGEYQEEEHNIPQVHKESVRIFALSYCVVKFGYTICFWF